MPIPTFSIYAGGTDITAKIRPGMVSMTITDGIGMASDTAHLTLDNINGVVRSPRTGEIINPRGGYKDIGGPRDFGLFVVDTVRVVGFPQRIEVMAQSLAAKELAKRKAPGDYRAEEFPTFGDVLQDVAGKAGLKLSMSAALKKVPNEYLANGEEEFIEFASRIGAMLDASVSIKSGRLVVVERGSGFNASGKAMQIIRIAKGRNIIAYSASRQDSPKHNEVEATWYDRAKNKRMVEKVAGSSEGPPFLIRTPFQSAAEAKLAAKRVSNELQRAERSATFEIDGDPFASAGAHVIASGLNDGADGLWSATTVTHNFSASGPYSTTVECEAPTPGSGT